MSLTIWQLDPVNLTPYYNLALCKALAHVGQDVTYITSRYLYDDTLPHTDVVNIDYTYFRGLGWPRLMHYPRLRKILRGLSYPGGHGAILRRLRQNPPDILHIQWSRLPWWDVRFIRQVRAYGVKVVHSVHDVVPLYDETQHQLAQVYGAADALIVFSQASRQTLLHQYPDLAPQSVAVIPLMTLPNTATPTKASASLARQRLNLPSEAPVLLFAGNIKHYKGLDVLITAFDQVARAWPDLHLIIVGKVHDDLPTNMTRLEAYGQRVIFQDQYIPYGEMWVYHLAADVVIFPYRNIYQSDALLTAMAFERPVIVSDAGGLPEVVDGNGWIFPTDDAEALAEAIREAVKDRDHLAQMGTRSLELIKTLYSGPAIAQQTLALYHQVLSGD